MGGILVKGKQKVPHLGVSNSSAPANLGILGSACLESTLLVNVLYVAMRRMVSWIQLTVRQNINKRQIWYNKDVFLKFQEIMEGICIKKIIL